MEEHMNKNNQNQPMAGDKTLNWGIIIAVVILLSLSLGGLLYAFLVPVP
jgi:hypothetical protein